MTAVTAAGPQDGSRPQDQPRDAGMSLVEVLVAVGLFGVLGSLLLGLAVSTGQVTDDVRSLTSINEESRLAMERMSRELRQATIVTSAVLPPAPPNPAQPTALTFWTDFNGNGAQDISVADPEVLTYRWDPTTKQLSLTANDASGTAVTRPVLAANVTRFELELGSSSWQHDANGDGSTSWQELDALTAGGNGNGVPDGVELEDLDLVGVTLTVLDGAKAQTYTSRVDLRNRS